MSGKEIDQFIPASPDYEDRKDAPPPDDKVFFAKDDPFDLFADWLAEASKSELNDPNAMSIATVDDDGMPNVRMVLLKHADPDGFVFYTNPDPKGSDSTLTRAHPNLENRQFSA